MSANNKEVVRALVDAINHHDIAAALSFYAPDYRDNTPGHEASGPETLQRAFAMMFNAFPDLHYSSEDIIAEGDKLVERFSSRGTHRGELMGAPPTGKEVTINGINIYRMSNGKIVERWAQVDDMGMMQQLGLSPGGPHSHE